MSRAFLGKHMVSNDIRTYSQCGSGDVNFLFLPPARVAPQTTSAATFCENRG